MRIEELINQNELHMQQVLRAELCELEFPPYVLRALKARGIVTLKDLTARSREDLLRMPFLGKKNVEVIEKILNNYDLKLK